MAARKSFLLLLANVSSSLIGAVATYVVAHRMGAEALGTVSYAMGLAGIAGIIGDLGFSQAHLRYTSGRNSVDDSVSTYGVIIALLTTAQAILLVAIPLLGGLLRGQALRTNDEWLVYIAFGAGLLATSGTRLFSTTYYAQEQVAKVGFALVTGSLAVGLAQIGVAALGLGVVPLGVAYQVEPVVRLITLWLLWKGNAFGRPRKRIGRQYVRYAAPLAVRSGLAALTGSVDKVLLRWLSSTRQVGFYTGNLGTAAAVSRLSLSATQVFFPRTVADVDRGDIKSATRRLKAVVRYLLLLGVPGVALVISFSREIVHLTLGDGFAESAPTLAVLAVHGLVAMITAPYESLLLALEKQAYLVPLKLASSAVLIVGSLLLIPGNVFGIGGPNLGSVGAAVALLAASAIGLGASIALTLRLTQSRVQRSRAWLIVGGVLIWGTTSLPSVFSLEPRLGTKVALAVAACGAFLGLMILRHQVSFDELGMMASAANPVHMIQYIRRELTSAQDVPN